MLRYRLSDAAQADVINILAWTHKEFGEAARLRYESLIIAALRDVATHPDRPGSIARPELGAGVRSWHLRLSRNHAATGAEVVRRPRHFIAALPKVPSALRSVPFRLLDSATLGC